MRLDDIDREEDLKDFRDRFFLRSRTTGRLSHPNIITVYDAGEQDGLAYIAMGISRESCLNCYCQKSTLVPAKQALQIVATVAEALDYAHSQGVIHRDVKPPNIMILKATPGEGDGLRHRQDGERFKNTEQHDRRDVAVHVA